MQKVFFFIQSNFFHCSHTYICQCKFVCVWKSTKRMCVFVSMWICVRECVGAQLNMADSVVGNEEAAVLPHIKTYS